MCCPEPSPFDGKLARLVLEYCGLILCTYVEPALDSLFPLVAGQSEDCHFPCRVVVGARSVEKLSQTQKECQRYTSHVHTVIGDISNETVCMAMVDKAVEEFGGIDILILNAALTDKEPKNFVDIEKPVSCIVIMISLGKD